MKYCSHCGKELLDEAVICPGCGCKAPSNSSEGSSLSDDDKKVLTLIIKILMIIGCVVTGWTLIPLLWTIPLTMHVWRKLDNKEPISLAVKICSLILVNVIAGIMLLCMDEIKDL